MEQTDKSIENKVDDSNADAGKHKHNDDDAGVVEHGLLAWPYHLFQFTFGVLEKALDSRGDTLKKAFRLLGFFVKCVFAAELAVFVHLKSVRIVFLVFHCVVITLFALCAS